jgi:signal transduction histidine kinase/CheY-like chemotaxis protein
VSPEGQACFETAYLRRDGLVIPVELSCRFIDYSGKPAVLSIARNITARKQAAEALRCQEEQLHQVQKMEAVGRLAGGVAHDFNNLLTVIMGYCEIMEMNFGQQGPLPQEVGQIKKASEQAAALTRQLLAFSRRQPFEPQALNLNTVVADMEKLLRRLLGENIEMRTMPAASLGRVKADKGQIEQVLMNLAVNAADAMPAGGILTIYTENVTLTPGHPQVVLEGRTGPYVCLTVTDTGMGMDQETRARIFDPFFTTKGPARGTGLGLSTVYGIVRQHEGWIEVDSEPGQGAAFRVYLPLFENQAESPLQEITALKKLQGRGERILVVEDDEGVRDLAGQGLRENGYEVVTAATAAEAQGILTREDGTFHLIFSDVVLPDFSALELMDRILPHQPLLRVLLTSGYTDEKSQWPLIQAKGWPFLHKPYSLADLLRHVKEVLEPKSPPSPRLEVPDT